MLHAKFQDHGTFDSGEDFRRFYHIWMWWPSWSCDMDHLYKLLFPLPTKAPHDLALTAVSEEIYKNG